MWRTPHVIAGFLIAPLVPSVALILIALVAIAVALIDGAPLSDFSDFGIFLFVLIYLTMTSYVVTLLLGVPTFLVLKRMGWVGVVPAALGGIAIGTIVGPVLGMTLLSQTFERVSTTIWPFSAASAMLAAIVFWLIARPDRA